MTAVLSEENAPALARLALPHFGLAADAPLEFVKIRENCVFRVLDADGPIALRLHRPGYRTAMEITAESEFIEALAAEGIPVAELIRTTSGAHAVTVEADGLAVVVDAQRWVQSAGQLGSAESAWDGSATLTPADFEGLGALAARLHDASEKLSRTHHFERAPWDREALVGAAPLWGDPRHAPGLSPAQATSIDSAMTAVDKLLRDYGTDPSIYGAIHADFTPENILTGADGYVVIDFDDFGDGWHMFDLATALFFYQKHPRYREMAEALLVGYRSVRPLRRDDEDLMDVFLLVRGLTYLGWAATRPETDTAGFIAEEVGPLVVDRAEALIRRGVTR
jgi:Ser/Thr protein kinase RdoA (MazF antagonist)